MQNKNRLEIKIVQTEVDKFKAMLVRGLVYIAEQHCPYEEEFDLNDYTATHILGVINEEPILTARIRYFGEFAKLERLAVRKEFRSMGYGQKLLDYMIDLCKKKGYKKIYLHAQEDKEQFYYKNGFKKKGKIFEFSGYRYCEMYLEFSQEKEVLDFNSVAMILNRPEGSWERPGPLERNSQSHPALSVVNM